MKRKNIKINFLFLLSCILFSSNAWSESSVWFCPNKSDILLYDQSDLSSWEGSLSDVKVYKFYYQSIMQDTPEKLRRKFKFLKDHNIAMAVEWPALTWQEGGVGYNIEGFSRPKFAQDVAKKIKDAGGDLKYIAIDEALFFGHYKSGKNYPGYDISTLAEKVADNMAVIWSIFPDAKVGDIEPIEQLPQDRYIQDLTTWVDAFKKSTGKSLAFLHNDVLWSADWITASKKIAPILHRRGVRYGVIFNAGKVVKTNDEWIDAAAVNVDRYLTSSAPLPDDAIFQSWNRFPNKILAGDQGNYSNNNNSILSLSKPQEFRSALDGGKKEETNVKSHVELITKFCGNKINPCK